MIKNISHNELVKRSISDLALQITDGLSQWRPISGLQSKPRQIVVCAMGGSALAADIIRYALWDRLTVPVIIVNNYELPAFVGRDTLLLVISYSGTTEETLHALRLAQRKRVPTVVMTAGQKLAERAKKIKVPVWQFSPNHNYSAQPRYGLGYLLAGVASLLASVLKQPEIVRELQQAAKGAHPLWSVSRQMAKRLGQDPVLLVASEHLLGVAHAAANQLNESAKRFAAAFALPELNHHLLEALATKKTKNWHIIFYESDLYFPRTRRRYGLTENIVKKLGLRVRNQKFTGSRLRQTVSALVWSSALSLELGRQCGYDPMDIPFVNELKRRLS